MKKKPEVKKIESKDKIREKFYTNGITVNDCLYVMYKRTSSKARTGSALFIKKEYFDEMMKWSHLGIDFYNGKKIDLASLKAYESLSLSSLESVLEIQPEQILLIDDQTRKHEKLFSVTELINGELVTTTKIFEIENILWDGQSLIDMSLCNSNKCMYLLRQRFFKSAAFKCDLQGYFKDHHITTVYDKYRNCQVDVRNIKLITTPSSLKLKKFKDKEDKINGQNYFLFWLSQIINSKFGVCKHEKSSHFDEKQRLSYQVINTLPLSYDEVKKIATDEIEYVKKIKNEHCMFMKHTSLYKPLSTHTLLQNVITVNKNIMGTDEFKDYRQHTITEYVKDLRQGHIKIKDCDYAVLCGNPIEMIRAACGEINMTSLHEGYQVFCSKFKDGENLAGFRSPHICSGNVLHCTNKYHDEFKYIKLTDNIVITNSYNTDLQDRLQGCDFDSDFFIINKQ